MGNIWLKYDKISDTDGIVTWINNVPYDSINGIPAEEIPNGVFVDSIPPLDETKNNMGHELHINPTTLTLTWVYFDIPPENQPTDIRVSSLESQTAQILLSLVNNNLL